MTTWTKQIALTAALSGCAGLMACTGQIGNPTQGTDSGPGSGSGAAPGTAAGTGAGTTAGVPVPATPIDEDGDGNTDGFDTDGDGIIDTTTDPNLDPVTTPTSCIPGVPGTSQLPRLTRVQYDNTIRDLTGIVSEPSSMLAPDPVGGVGSVDQRAWDGYQSAAQSLASEIMADPNARAQVIPCTPDGDGAACAQLMVETFGQRAFRRPLTADESARFMNLYTTRAAITETGTFDEAAEVIIKAFLASPSFLTRAEITEQPEGDRYVLGPYEVASRMSYMLWGSMPDEALFASAAAGTLSTPDGILAEAQRMLADPKARNMVAEFHKHYVHMGAGTRWAEITRDPAVYPAFNEAQVPLMSHETELLFDHIVFEQGGSFQDLITTPVAFVNATTAPLYGLDSAQYGADLVPVTLDPATRPGIFTRAGFLASHSSYNRTSPILRGAFIQEEILCTDIPPPPPDVEGTPLPTEGLTTNRERVDAQTAAPACANCHHSLINPTGFAMESFDAIGAVQATDNGAPVVTTATVPIGATTVDVTGPADLMAAIANSPEAQRCYAQKWVTHAYQRGLNPQDSCVVDNLTGKLTQGGYTVLNLVADLTQSDSFRYRVLEVAQ